MKKWIKYWPLTLVLTAASALNGCAVVKNNASLCRIRFDCSDPAVEELNLQNLRALSVWKEACGG